ncbi:hypothetical protein PAHAL_9G479700 [Panicum hallii]|uniref:Uncharacterized protein n=1 Tax=Panicum hallii TaxID=206008 RepID=A0A2T8I509_9POAL|nr:hypothetical protein PAHAL_9G479700 [Panicum hallii]
MQMQIGQHQADELKQRRNTRVRKGKQAFNTSTLSNKTHGWVQRSILQTRLPSSRPFGHFQL